MILEYSAHLDKKQDTKTYRTQDDFYSIKHSLAQNKIYDQTNAAYNQLNLNICNVLFACSILSVLGV